MDLISYLCFVLQHLHKLPWESTPQLQHCSITRMPSLLSLSALCVRKQVRMSSVDGFKVTLRLFKSSFKCLFFQYDHTTVSFQGLNMNKVFYVLDPDGNLENSNQQFRDMFAE